MCFVRIPLKMLLPSASDPRHSGPFPAAGLLGLYWGTSQAPRAGGVSALFNALLSRIHNKLNKGLHASILHRASQIM